MLIIVIFGIVLITGRLNINSWFYIILFVLGLFSIPLSMSIYLAKDIALTNKNLEEQLETVKDLSAKELDHQKRTAELELKAELQKAENERKTKELEGAREPQLSLLPKNIPELSEYEIAVHMETATEVGGDYYDFHLQSNILTIAIGDATGHGLMAGTMVTATKSLFNSFAGNQNIISILNQMSDSLREMHFKLLSMCFAIIKIKDKKLKISSAGMPPLYIYRKEDNVVEEIFLRGMPLGANVSYNYELKETELQKGDTVFLYSDGFPELFNKDQEMFSYNRLKKELLKIADNDPQTIVNRLNETIEDWAGDIPPNDDITFVVIKIK
jgi:serine phosphatase RsbU (regulator of sigma subunit)